MNAQQAAEKIGTDAKTLRRFIRSPKSTFKAVGSGGRYEFDEKDIPTLKKLFTAWRTAPTQKTTRDKETVAVAKFKDTDSPMPVSILHGRMPRKTREQRDAMSRARVDRLEAQLRAANKHISQRNEWADVR